MKDIPGYEGRYAVTEDGKVWSYPKQYRLYTSKGRYLTGHKDDRGYISIGLSTATKRVHRLVGLTYIPNPENKPEINHKNGIKTDNRVENLEWCTNKENTAHAWRQGLTPQAPILRGEQNPTAKLTEKEVLEIRSKYIDGFTPKQLSAEYGVAKPTIWDVIYKRRWKHI